MAEEFQESEVIFEDQVDDEDSSNEADFNPRKAAAKMRKKQIKSNNKKSSVPVSIPDNASRNSWRRCVESEFDDGEMVPPHIIIGRRVAGKVMAYSVCTGKGRTLKGRELCQVRNSILRMTGFLET